MSNRPSSQSPTTVRDSQHTADGETANHKTEFQPTGATDPTIASLREFETDCLWVGENRATLLAQFPERWIAVRGCRVIASNSDFDTLLKALDDPPRTCVEFITNEPSELIL